MGGLLGTFIAMHFYKLITKKKNTALGGSFAIPFAVALGFGKIGCYFNGCCSGKSSVPIQLIESMLQFLVAYLLFPLYMFTYLILRFFAEFIRHPEKIFYCLTLYQWLCIIFMPIAGYIIYKRIKGEKYVSE